MNILRHARNALRGLRRTPAFTITAVLILGIGIGMSVAVITVYNTVLRHPLPVAAPDRIVVLWTHRGDPALEISGSFKQLTQQFRPESRALANVAGVAHWGAVPTAFLKDGEPIVVNRALVSHNFFEVLGAKPLLGRLLRSDDPEQGRELPMVISYGAWKRWFGGDSSVIGRRISDAWGQSTFTIVGVAAPGLDYPSGVEVWTTPWADGLGAYAIARLAPNATAAGARDEYFAIENRLLPDLHVVGATATSFSDAMLGKARPIVALLMGGVALLLILACINVGNLLLLRAVSRERDLRIRRALGATLGDLVRQLAAESVALGVAGGAIGLVVSQVLLKALVAFAPDQLPRLDALAVAGAPFGTVLLVTLFATILFGTLPTLSAAGKASTSSLRVEGRAGDESRRRRRVRQSLVAAQIALALVLLAGAGVLVRSLERLTRLDLGYKPEHLAILQLSWTAPDPNKFLSIGEALLQRYRAVPGVQSVTPALIPPFLGANVFHGQVIVEGQPASDQTHALSVPLELGDGSYFKTFGIPIVRGRGLLNSDREDALPVAVVSEAVARQLWPNVDPIGKRIRYFASDSLMWRTVVGVAGDIRFRNLREATPTIYLPWRQPPKAWQMEFAVRTTAALSPVVNALRRETRAVDAGLSIWSATSMDEYLAGPLSQPRLSTLLLSGFGLVALVIAVLGLYGLMAAAVRDQTREIGVRMALGATPQRVRIDVLTRAMVVTSAGAAVGLIAALAGTRVLSSLLFDVSPTDPIALFGAAAVLLGAAGAAAYVPARRATAIEPVVALRGE